MFYPEFEVKVNTGLIMVGDYVWVTGYYHDNPLQKPTRHVPPTLVEVTSNKSLPSSRRIPTSGYHFCPLGKSGKVLSKVILPYEGALGVLWNSGNYGSLNIFLTEVEARDSYVEAAEVVKVKIAEARKAMLDDCDRLAAEVDARIAKNK